jgi:flagellar FliJ protein
MAVFRLQILVDYAEERSKTAAREVQRIRLKWAQEEQKKNQLEGYLDDYRARLTWIATGGISIVALLDFRRFIAKLELAISTQSEEIVRCKQQWEVAKKLWFEREREVKAYHALRTRHEQAETVKEERQDQRLQDEFAQLIHRRQKAEKSPS